MARQARWTSPRYGWRALTRTTPCKHPISTASWAKVGSPCDTEAAMRKHLLICLGIALTLVIGFFVGRWSAGGWPADRGREDPEPTGLPGTRYTLRKSDAEETRARVGYLIEMLASKNP